MFYNNSAFDSGNPAANAADDGALDSSKVALLPGGTGDFFNVTSYHRGLNGVMIDVIGLPAGVTLETGGELEQASKANSAIVTALPIGMLLLLFFLILEFNSFRRMAIILVKVPLAAIGVVPGLILAGQPFGFTAILGLIALVGIVVNNGIVLIDLIEVRRKEGAGIDEAIEDAIVRRTRPILLTAGTAVLGLLPLGFTEATLWPPLAWTR